MATAYKCDKCGRLYIETKRKFYSDGKVDARMIFEWSKVRDTLDICDECALECYPRIKMDPPTRI